MAVQMIDTSGRQRKVFLDIRARRKFLKCIEKELRKSGIVSEAIQGYLVVGGEKIDLKEDKDFEYIPQKRERIKCFNGRLRLA